MVGKDKLVRKYETPEINITRFDTQERIMIYGGGEETSNDGNILISEFYESSTDATDFQLDMFD